MENISESSGKGLSKCDVKDKYQGTWGQVTGKDVLPNRGEPRGNNGVWVGGVKREIRERIQKRTDGDRGTNAKTILR